jgi:competence protein ComEC
MSKAKRQLIIRISLLVLLIAAALIIDRYGSSQETQTTQSTSHNGVMEVHFIDVGQGDSILIEAEDSAMLIDAGENNKGSVVVDYLKAQNITKLDYVIGTHPHSDHIGGLDTVIDTYQVGKVIMPEVAHTTKTYEDVLDAIDKKGLSIIKPVVGDVYTLGSASFTILAPNSSSYEEMNDYSIVIKLTYGDNSFLLTGDAGSLSEEEMLASGFDLSADVLKLGHHGSAYSSTESFLDAVNPGYAVVSVGADNEYGHPHPDTLMKIKSRNIKLYRTDRQGTIVFTSDGKTISVNTQECEITTDDLDN